MNLAARAKPIVTLTMKVIRADGSTEEITVPATATGIEELEHLVGRIDQQNPELTTAPEDPGHG